ncbi:MAG: hypothetical protein FJX74_08590 [Armatimonadetes bacterium]|nr:hypothetical protein [Armatimonadota bacterium]
MLLPGEPPPAPKPPPPHRDRLLLEAAEALGPFPSPAEQGAVDTLYCPDYRPELYPELTVGQMCSASLLTSPLLEQGEAGKNPFQVAFREVRRMETRDSALAKKALLAAAYYWQHRRSEGALTGAAATLLAEESTGFACLLVNAAVPPAVKRLPGEFSGLPPPAEFGPGYDVRAFSVASYNSVADAETLLLTAAERGLAGIAITDLDHLDGLRAVQRAAQALKAQGRLPAGFEVLPGEEISTLSGPVIGLFLTDRIRRGMTIKATVDAIHRQGGVAILADPGTGSGPKLARALDVDGYLLRSHSASLFRTLELMDEPDAVGKPLLAGSGSQAAGSVGVPYTVVETQDRSPEGVRQAFRERMTYGATGVQMPLMAALLFRPLAVYQKTMVRYFQARDSLEEHVARRIGSDNVELRTSYDREMAELLGLWHAPGVVSGLFDGSSALTRAPRPLRVSADYGLLRLEYTWDDHTIRALGAVQW